MLSSHDTISLAVHFQLAKNTQPEPVRPTRQPSGHGIITCHSNHRALVFSGGVPLRLIFNWQNHSAGTSETNQATTEVVPSSPRD
jgi:hypothetical protein